MSLKYIIFDFDGTIADTFDLHFRAGNAIADRFKMKKYTDADKENLKSSNFKQIIRDSNPHVKLYQYPLILKAARRFVKDNVHTADIFPEMKDIINELSQNYKLTILSSNIKYCIDIVLNKFKITNFLEVKTINPLVGKRVAFRFLLRRLKVKPNEILYIGDELSDIKACKAYNIPIIAVTWGFNSKAILESLQPNYIAEKPEDILKFVERHVAISD